MYFVVNYNYAEINQTQKKNINTYQIPVIFRIQNYGFPFINMILNVSQPI